MRVGAVGFQTERLKRAWSVGLGGRRAERCSLVEAVSEK